MGFNKKVGEKITYEEVKDFAKSLGFDLLEEEYLANNIKMKMICKNGHTSYKSLKNLQDCPTCNTCKQEKKRLNIYLDFKEHLEKEGYKINSPLKELLTKKTKMNITCPNGHSYDVSYEKFVQQNRRCGKCCNNQKFDDEEVKNILNKYGFEWLGGVYKNTSSKLTVGCENGHIYNTSLATVQRYGHCKYCYGYKGERRIAEVLNQANINVETQKTFKDCKDKKPLPFDFYLPDYNLIIEYDGEQHFDIKHSFSGEDGFVNTIIHDAIKNQYCEDNNINILRIPYWEFDNIEELIKEKIKNI